MTAPSRLLLAALLAASPALLWWAARAQTRVDAPTQARYMTGRTFYGAPLAFGVLPAGACAERGFEAPGVWPGARVAPGWPAFLPASAIGVIYAGSDILVVRICAVGAPADVGTVFVSASVLEP